MSLLTDPSSYLSKQGGTVLGGLPNLTHTLETNAVGTGNRALALAKSNQWANEAREKYFDAKLNPGPAPNPMNGLIGAGLQAATGIFGAGAPGSNANSGYDVGNELWQGVGQEFSSFASGTDLSGGVGSSLGSSWGDAFGAGSFLGGMG